MSEVKSNFSVQLKVENNQTILNRVLVVFSRRRIEVRNLTMATLDNHKHVKLSIETDPYNLYKLEKQLEKLIEVYEVDSTRINIIASDN